MGTLGGISEAACHHEHVRFLEWNGEWERLGVGIEFLIGPGLWDGKSKSRKRGSESGGGCMTVRRGKKESKRWDEEHTLPYLIKE